MTTIMSKWSNGIFLIEGFDGRLSTKQAAAMIKEEYGVEISTKEWVITSNHITIGKSVTSSYKFVRVDPESSVVLT